MARLGKKTVTIPPDVKLSVSAGKVIVEGKNGKLEFALHSRISLDIKDNIFSVKTAGDTKLDRSLQGTVRAVIINMTKGVTEGYLKQLDIIGVGFRAQIQQNKLNLQLGFSHPVVYAPPDDIKIETPKPNQILIKGIDKVKVGQVAAEIRSIMPPEPYKGKGIRYSTEFVRKKVGKAVTK